MATTIINSTKVKACFVNAWRILSCRRSWSWVDGFMERIDAAQMRQIVPESTKTVKN